VRWPPDYSGPALTTVKRGSCVPFDEDFKENDVLIVVRFVTTPLSEIGNPKSLVCERLIDEAREQNLQQFPDARIAEGGAPVVEETIIDNVHSCSDAAPCEETD
jgi:hypothetical protein